MGTSIDGYGELPIYILISWRAFPNFGTHASTFTADRKHDHDPAFRAFKRKLYHQSISAILSSLKPAMTTPVLRRCPDGYFRRVIYDLASFIADYPEQVLLTGIVQGWCPKCVIIFLFNTLQITYSCGFDGRCTAFAADLDAPGAGRRTRGLYEALMEEFAGDGAALWDNYGIDEDVVVCRILLLVLYCSVTHHMTGHL